MLVDARTFITIGQQPLQARTGCLELCRCPDVADSALQITPFALHKCNRAIITCDISAPCGIGHLFGAVQMWPKLAGPLFFC